MNTNTVQLTLDEYTLLIRMIESYIDNDLELPIELSQSDIEELSQLRDKLLFLADSQV